jgi:hypothetical protein
MYTLHREVIIYYIFTFDQGFYYRGLPSGCVDWELYFAEKLGVTLLLYLVLQLPALSFKPKQKQGVII